jgi:hypothetical protein
MSSLNDVRVARAGTDTHLLAGALNPVVQAIQTTPRGIG